jgi:hypothetical protein
VKGIIEGGEKALRAMGSQSISKIESFVEETLTSIREIDLRPVRKEITEEDYRNLFLTSPVDED